MKKLSVLAFIAVGLIWASCSDEKGRYVDLRTGETITVEKDPQSGAWINAETRQPVYIYVDSRNNDTIYGKTGAVINGHVKMGTDNVYWYDADMETEYKVKSDNEGDYKKEVEKDGDIKIKDGDKKIKIDGETGEKKVKIDD